MRFEDYGYEGLMVMTRGFFEGFYRVLRVIINTCIQILHASSFDFALSHYRTFNIQLVLPARSQAFQQQAHSISIPTWRRFDCTGKRAEQVGACARAVCTSFRSARVQYATTAAAAAGRSDRGTIPERSSLWRRWRAELL